MRKNQREVEKKTHYDEKGVSVVAVVVAVVAVVVAVVAVVVAVVEFFVAWTDVWRSEVRWKRNCSLTDLEWRASRTWERGDRGRLRKRRD